MKLGHLFVAILATLSSTRAFSAHHAFQRPPLVDIAGVEKLLAQQSNSPKTVEDFLEKLPLVYRSHFTLMYDSRSMHKATPEAPRIIFFGPDARLLTAVSTDRTDPRHNIVELIQFEPSQSKFSFHEISFDSAQPQVNHAPQKCQNCHGSDLRPNWEPYDAWPGAYGSIHDKMAYKTHENRLFSDFLASYKKESRFLSLPERFTMKQETFGGDPTYYTVSRGVGLNSTFSLLVSFANRERIAKAMIQSSNHSRYRNAITSALLGCPESPESLIPTGLKSNHLKSYSAILAETQEIMEKDHKRRVQQTADLQKIGDLEEFEAGIDRYGLREKEVVRIAKLRYLLENRRTGSTAMDRWSLSLYRDSYNFNDGARGLENLIGHYVPMAYSDTDALKGKIQYKTIPFDTTSYSEIPGHSGGKDAFKLELFEAMEPALGLCADLKAHK